MSNASDFVIENGVLKKYVGPGGDVVVPEGVTKIGNWAFDGCSSLTSIVLPESISIIGDYSFSGCSGLTSVTIPDSVTSIGDNAFAHCGSLTGFTLPKSLTSIGSNVFWGCKGQMVEGGFVVFGETLLSYQGQGGNVVVPNGVKLIGDGAFYGCDVDELKLPLSAVTGKMFGQSGKTIILTVTRPDRAPVRVVASFRKEYWSQTWNYPQDYLLPLSEEAILVYDKLVAGGSYDGFSMNENGRIRAALWRLADADFPIADELRGAFADFLASKLSKAIKYAEEDKAPEYIRTLVSVGAINADNQKKASKAILKSDIPEIRAMAEQLTAPAAPAQPVQQEESRIDPRFTARIKKINAVGVLTKSGIEALPPVMLKDGFEAPVDYLRLILAEYCRQVRTEDCLPVPLADEAAELLNRSSLNVALRTIYDGIVNEKQQLAMLLPLFRYAEGPTIRELYPKNHNTKWKEQAANRALLLSDTREAMLYADKQGILWKYAEMRGTDADTLRDTVLSEFGFDGDGCKTYDLGSGTLTAMLNDDLTLTLRDDKSGKTVKSVPKKNADPDQYEAAKADLTELRKNVKRVAKNRADRLFEAFLNGREFDAGDWKAIYLTNPVLNRVARLLVWVQGETSFTLSASGTVRSDGEAYPIGDKPIRVAHPLELSSEDAATWQNYFLARGLKQPFQQVWEPVRNAEEILPDRYDGITIPLNFFKGAEKHGLRYLYLGAVDLSFTGCLVQYNVEGERRHELDPDSTVEITDFRFPKYTRQVNHIVTVLDRWTVRGRIMKDDLSVMDLMPGFTLAQIMDFIAAAQEANATNVLAALLEYKNAHFADFDPMDEFTLEW